MIKKLFPSFQDISNDFNQSMTLSSSLILFPKFPLFSNEDECYEQSLKLEEKYDPNNPQNNNNINNNGTSNHSSSSLLSSLPSSMHSSSGSNLVRGLNSTLGSKSHHMLRNSLQKIKSSRF